MDKKIRVGVLGATGMVGQHFITLLQNHPWFELVVLAASPRSAGKSYYEAVEGRWAMQQSIPEQVGHMQVLAVQEDAEGIAEQVDAVFCALDLGKAVIQSIEELYAGLNVAVISNNSAHRWTDDVPMIIPEVNPEHLKLIDVQRKNRGWDKGLIVVKPNCSIQSYVLVLTALKQFQPTEMAVTSLQAISGAGKTFDSWPEMVDNVIPYIEGEEEKSVNEPLKIWGWLGEGSIVKASAPEISATCIRVPTSNGHMASVSVNFANNPSRQVILEALNSFHPAVYEYNLPSQPAELFHFFEEPDRPQTKLDRDLEQGFAVSIGRLRQDTFFDWDFVALAHNTVRGAAGGAVLTAELLVAEGYIGAADAAH